MTESKRIRFGFMNNNLKGHVAATLLQAEVKVLLSQKGLSHQRQRHPRHKDKTIKKI